jgi:hypothetical protein
MTMLETIASHLDRAIRVPHHEVAVHPWGDSAFPVIEAGQLGRCRGQPVGDLSQAGAMLAGYGPRRLESDL